MHMEEEVRYSIRFPRDLLETLKHLAHEDKRSINSEIVWVLREFARERGKDAKKLQIPPLSKQDH